MSQRICGIDPGLSGALAVLDGNDVVLLTDLPVHRVAAGNKRRDELDLAGLRQLLHEQRIDHAIIERVASRPGQGTVSMFRFGYAAGAVHGLLAGLQIPCSFVSPQTWQRVVKVGKGPDEARQRASQLYPGSIQQLTRKKDAGRADALLIAHWGSMASHWLPTAWQEH